MRNNYSCMTFSQAKTKLDKMTTLQHDKIQVILSKLFQENINNNKEIADAIELSSMALMLYTKGGK